MLRQKAVVLFLPVEVDREPVMGDGHIGRIRAHGGSIMVEKCGNGLLLGFAERNGLRNHAVRHDDVEPVAAFNVIAGRPRESSFQRSQSSDCSLAPTNAIPNRKARVAIPTKRCSYRHSYLRIWPH